MLQQLQSPFTYTAPEHIPNHNNNLLLPTPTFSEKSSDSTVYCLQTPISPIKKQLTMFENNLSMIHSKVSMMEDCALKREIFQLIQNSVHILQEVEDNDTLPQRTFDEFIIHTPPSSFEETFITPPPSSNQEFCYQTPRDKIIDYENCAPPAPPKQPNFDHAITNLNCSNLPNIIFSEEDLLADGTVQFNQHFLDWDSFEFDSQDLSF
ncbi:uncharacterized protein SPAPADRAFT_63681 [Spathaspora passalidarum NRRL Y-27907]|uniref:Uncharacterized protein n=1 Tax=Spathaspora passalidarum (strain NRRL Y-27907 / 11-Y1) TaxID=619300 RepID=G3AUX2_SPAPN|nr:uncharacterized protein SPAPADRAFT_63681 [Spathaspora passalidarum NRRL Y-27907]EGW30063.1 hypothetical protein SPAPADRAFT_63681 [Spathaspora passalidarum NRRL Y-27907]